VIVPSGAIPHRLLSLEEFLAFESASPLRHEFVAGEVYPITGATRRHNQVVWNILSRLKSASQGSACEVYFEAVKLRVDDDIYYPDVVVTCSTTDNDAQFVSEPCLLVEVTSPGTARADRTEKLSGYQRIRSLQAYLVVEQAWRRVVRHWRRPTGEWAREELLDDGVIRLRCPEITISLDQIYAGLAPLSVKEMEAIGYLV
jgi:Uma2 family endonuclease